MVVVDNIVSDMLVIIQPAPNNWDGPSNIKSQYHANKLLKNSKEESYNNGLSLDIYLV